MKKKLVLLIIAFVAITVRGEINLFSYNADGSIVSSKTLINDLEWDSSISLESAPSFLAKTTDGTEYSIKLKKTTDPGPEGIYNQIEIQLAGKSLLTLKNIDVWKKMTGSNKYYLQVPLSPTSMALCFVGHCYNTQPPLLTIVVVNKNQASLVFNQECYFLSYINNNNEFSIVYSDQIQETNEDGSPYPATNQLKQWKIWRDGDILKHTQIK